MEAHLSCEYEGLQIPVYGYLGGDPHPAFGLVPLEEGTVQSPQGKLLNN